MAAPKESKKSGLRIDSDEDQEPKAKKSGRLVVDDAEDVESEDEKAPAPKVDLAGEIGDITPPRRDTSVNAAGDVVDPNAIVQFACLKPIDHPPTVGTFRFTDYGMQELKVDYRYKLPHYVAQHLVDRGYGSIV